MKKRAHFMEHQPPILTPHALSGRVIILLVGSYLVFGAAFAIASPQAATETLLKQAGTYESQRNNSAAEQAYLKALRLAPDNPEILKRLGVLCLRENRFQRSIEMFQRILSSHSDYPEANFYLGFSYYALNDFTHAIESFRRELATKHPRPRCRYYLALAYASEGQAGKATAQLNEMVAENPKDADALYQLARLHMNAAFDTVKKLKSLDPDSFQMHALMAEIYSNEQNYTWAIKEYQAALRKRPGATGLHYALGIAYWATGHYVPARSEFLKALKESPDSPLINFYLGAIAVHQGLYQQSVPYLEKAQKSLARMMPVHMLLGQSYEELNELQKAEAQLLLATHLEPDAPRPHYLLAQVYRKLHKTQESQREMASYGRLRQGQQQKALEKAQNVRELEKGPGADAPGGPPVESTPQ
jgi:predicted Zn-dependent protease